MNEVCCTLCSQQFCSYSSRNAWCRRLRSISVYTRHCAAFGFGKSTSRDQPNFSTSSSALQSNKATQPASLEYRHSRPVCRNFSVDNSSELISAVVNCIYAYYGAIGYIYQYAKCCLLQRRVVSRFSVRR